MIWPGPHIVAGTDHVALADLPAADADLLGEPVDARPPSRTAPGWRRTRGTRRTIGLLVRTATVSHVDRRHVVRPAGVAGGAFEHLHPDAGVGARVADAAHPQRGETAVGVAARPSTPGGSGGAWRACSRLSSRDSVHFTGRSSSQAASAAWAWLLMSSLPPNAPPFDTSSTVTRVVADAEHAGDVVAVVPHALAARVDVQRAARRRSSTARRASPRARGRRARCAASGTPRARCARSPRGRRRRRPASTR